MAKMHDTSRFTNTEMLIIDGVEVFGSWEMPSYLLTRPSNVGRLKIKSALEGRPDLIAAEIYGTTSLDWVLIAFNNVRSLNWPRAGETIEYPPPQLVFTEL